MASLLDLLSYNSTHMKASLQKGALTRVRRALRSVSHYSTSSYEPGLIGEGAGSTASSNEHLVIPNKDQPDTSCIRAAARGSC
jgi:hypothetical protein